MNLFQPTRPLRGATSASRPRHLRTEISTHAPLAGRDYQPPFLRWRLLDFNPRAPCGARPKLISHLANRDAEISTHAPLAGRDQSRNTLPSSGVLFQPTRPLRGATIMAEVLNRVKVFQPTRPLRGATIPSCAAVIIAPRFQPTRPLRGATGTIPSPGHEPKGISTHAPLAGRDVSFPCKPPRQAQFQPTRPLRGATIKHNIIILSKIFQPTRPLRGATVLLVKVVSFQSISTHAPLAGRDAL